MEAQPEASAFILTLQVKLTLYWWWYLELDGTPDVPAAFSYAKLLWSESWVAIFAYETVFCVSAGNIKWWYSMELWRLDSLAVI